VVAALPNAVAARFERLVRKAGVTPIRIRGLRHTRATLMIADGVPDRMVADQLGHRDTRFRASVYVHPPQAPGRRSWRGPRAGSREVRHRWCPTRLDHP
jgi:integrase